MKRVKRGIIPKKGDTWQEIVRKCAFLVALSTFLVSMFFIFDYLTANFISDTVIKDTQELYYAPPTSNQIANLPFDYLPKFSGLYEANPDIKGWITIPDTKVDHPVVQGKNNEEYLYADFFKKDNKNGVPFIDFRNKITKGGLDFNTVIYAHNILGGRFFAELVEYQKLDYYKAHPIINFDTIYEEAKWQIAAIVITNAYPEQDNGRLFSYNNFLNFDTDMEFEEFKYELENRTIIDTGVEIKPDDNLICLSTCTYEFEEARMVIFARKVKDGEEAMPDLSKAGYNPIPYYPKAWYEKAGGEQPFYPQFSGSSEEAKPLSSVKPEDIKPYYEVTSKQKNYSFPYNPDEGGYVNSKVSSEYGGRTYAMPSRDLVSAVPSNSYKPPKKNNSSKKKK